ncbi:MAG: RnfABCDGE type electron transport complex subunit G [Lachnospiraceae bacterium]|jgi:electron transport complex protein RnfG|nr:RnfABCDGE type electron transport complex subunit G [Lachnospiraceae bacterium]
MSENKQKSSLIKDALILFAITIIAAFALGAVYEITKDPIAEAEAKAKTEAAQAVFAEMKETSEASAEEVSKAQALIDQNNKNKEFDTITIDEVLQALDENGNKIGDIITVTSKKGYGGQITIIMGVSDDETLKGIEFLSISETPGLGMKAKDDDPDKDSDFKDQFKGVQPGSYKLTKRNINMSGTTEIDAISSATITTSAVTNMLNAGLMVAASID